VPTGRDRKLATHYLALGKQLGLDQQYHEALESLREAARLDPTSASAWVTLALTHYRLGEYRECIGAADEATKHDYDNADSWNYRGLALLRLGRAAEALIEFIHVASLYPSEPVFALNAGGALYNLRRYDLALSWSERAFSPPSRYWPAPYWLASVNLAVTLICLGRLEDAGIPLASVAAVAADQCMFWATPGLLNMRRRQYDDALVAIKRAIESDHEDPSGWESMAELLMALDDFPKALEVAEHGLTSAHMISRSRS
jgi:tetratricopeptide (TPR) repeat protein